MSKDGSKCSTPWVPVVVDFPSYNNAVIDWYIRMPTDAPLVEPNTETPLGLCKEEDAILKPTFPMVDNWFPL